MSGASLRNSFWLLFRAILPRWLPTPKDGNLDETKSNAILVFHALSGDQFVTGTNNVTGRDGWWNQVVGSGLPIDTDKYFVICANVLGGCMGSN